MNKHNRNRKEKYFSIRQMKWIYLIGIIVIIGGVMSYGLIGFFAFEFDEHNSITMVLMIPPMLVVYTIAVRLMTAGMEKRMKKLIDAVHEVSNGNLEYQIELDGAEEYRTLYAEFNKMAAELSKTRSEMEAFTNEFAHEFKTPITAIKGFAELLYDAEDSLGMEERKEYMALIKDESERLSKLSADTLLLSKVNAMQILSDKEDYDLCEQIRHCIIMLNQEFDDKGIELEFSEDISLIYNGNKELLEHVWLNLLSNAVKYSDRGGKIKITFVSDEYKIETRITDSGRGMAEDTLRHIFDKYYQHDKGSDGNGIGLSIVKRIVELSGGSVCVESYPGTGSTFIVSLPK